MRKHLAEGGCVRDGKRFWLWSVLFAAMVCTSYAADEPIEALSISEKHPEISPVSYTHLTLPTILLV